ncbi:hypothetical protein ALMP_67910 [Streptomyces sp. A012304]|nr:hypothetical protein ALMP_67910 [Streptomyces sp. A012304]
MPDATGTLEIGEEVGGERAAGVGEGVEESDGVRVGAGGGLGRELASK